VPAPDRGMGEGCADGADPEGSGTPREISWWPAGLAGCDGGWIRMRQAAETLHPEGTSPSFARGRW